MGVRTKPSFICLKQSVRLFAVQEEAEAAVSSKTRFLAAASHDLLQPINAAKLLISTLRDMAEDTPLDPMVERLEGSFGSVETLLHALLDISRLESTGTELSPTEFCLGSLIQTVIEDQGPIAAKKGVQLDMVPCSVWVRSDQRYLMRSIQNLVVNAIQYTEPGGKVVLGCRRRGDKVELQVLDTGIGIDPQDHLKIFDAFEGAPDIALFVERNDIDRGGDHRWIISPSCHRAALCTLCLHTRLASLGCWL